MKKLCEKLGFLVDCLVFLIEKGMKEHSLVAIDETEQLLKEVKQRLRSD